MYKRVLLLLVLVSGLGLVSGCTSKNDSADKGKDAQPPKSDASLANTYWKLTEIEGGPASLGVGQKELNVVLTAEDERMRGFSGCNQFAGPYMASNGRLHIGPLVSTMMACEVAMEQEHRFLEALGRTKRFTISGDILTLFGSDGQPILRFAAVYME